MEGKKKKMELQGKKKKTEGKRSLFYVFRIFTHYHIYKLDLSRHFVPATADINYFGRGKATRKKKKRKRTIAGHHRPPCMLEPYMAFESLGFWDEGEFPNDMAVAALGSKIYLIGGNLCRKDKPLPRDVYVIDTARDQEYNSGCSIDNYYPEITKMSCKLNSGKRHPIACTIRGNIYVMPHTLSEVEFHKASFHHCPRATGKFFERYDPDSNLWTILPSPPAENHLSCADEKSDPLLVKSHTVLGSTLVISLATVGFVYAFDATRPDLGWRKIRLVLELGARRRLNFLPLDPDYSSPVGDDLVLCYPRHKLQPPDNVVSGLVKKELDIDCRTDYYLCRFDDIAVSGDDLKATIVPLDGSPMRMRWEKFFTCNKSSQLSWLGDGLVLFAKIGCDFDEDAGTCCSKCFKVEQEHDVGDTYMSFELFRVSHDREMQASGTCSALFKLDEDVAPRLDFSRCFVMEDGLFLT